VSLKGASAKREKGKTLCCVQFSIVNLVKKKRNEAVGAESIKAGAREGQAYSRRENLVRAEGFLGGL